MPQFSIHRSSFSVLRRALTLVEMLVSLACVMILMMAYTQLFSNVGASINGARSMIELSNRMRSAENMLRNDLAGHTCDMTVWQRPESGAGYFEILEGPLSDRNPGIQTSAPVPQTYPLGDSDDVLMFTTRSQPGTPFAGRNGLTNPAAPPGPSNPVIRIEGEVAEVAWFLRPTMQPPASTAPSITPVTPPTFTLYRRVFLVTPSAQPLQVPQTAFATGEYDRSMHRSGTDMVPNTLGDLTKRENRAAHAGNFPFRVDPATVVPFGGQVLSNIYSINPGHSTYPRYGEDAVLTNVIAFDVQVWDPTSPIYVPSATTPAVNPTDPGFPYPRGTAIPTTPVPSSTGSYVDLNWHHDAWTGAPVAAPWNNNLNMSPFHSTGHPKSQLVAAFPATTAFNYVTSWLTGAASSGQPAVYDTWSFHYENDGIDQDSATDGGKGPDQGTNGKDDDGTNGVDDPGERETSPPYPYPLRGIKITLRCYEPDSRQVREVSITESFVPE